ncbi:MAG: hypothetical protein LBR35_00990 [Rickettsiales bacterium]|nr:hypothetical protein [Rickettsiales bacterium]
MQKNTTTKKPTNKSKLTRNNFHKAAKKGFNQVKKETIAHGKSVASQTKDFANKASKYEWKNFKSDAVNALRNFWESIVSPKKQFDEIKQNGNYDNEVVKTGIYGVFGAIIAIAATLLFGHFEVSTLLKLIYIPVGAIIFLFTFAGLVNMFSFFCKGDVNFEVALKTMADKMYILPIVILINILSFKYWILIITSLAVDLYILYMIYAFVMYGAKGNKKLTQSVFAIFALLTLLVYLSSHIDLWLALKNPQVVFFTF